MTQDYLRTLYGVALSDYKLATNETQQQKALAEMARITATATVLYGFGLADELRRMAA